MIVYLASPNTQQQAEHATGMPVLLSYACCSPWIEKGYQETFSRLLIDSGAYSEFTTGRKVEISEYSEWAEKWRFTADAIAGLDDIAGDWRKSMRNFEKFPDGFPTFHDSDPPEFLDDLVAMATSRKKWIGIGLVPPRHGKEKFLRETLDRIPDGIHVHGWALRKYTHLRRLDSVDSTNWWRDAMDLRVLPGLGHLTYGECLEIVVKRYQRWTRKIVDYKNEDTPLFDGIKE